MFLLNLLKKPSSVTIIIGTAMLAACTQGPSSNWVSMPPSQDSSYLMLFDQNSISAVENEKSSYFFQIVGHQNSSMLKEDNEIFKSALVSSKINCSERTITTMNVAMYDQLYAQGQLIYKLELNKSAKIIADDLQELFLYDSICGK